MKKIYILCVEFYFRGDQKTEHIKAYQNLDDAKQAFEKQIEFEKNSTWIIDVNEDDLDILKSPMDWYCKNLYSDDYTNVYISEVDFE